MQSHSVLVWCGQGIYTPKPEGLHLVSRCLSQRVAGCFSFWSVKMNDRELLEFAAKAIGEQCSHFGGREYGLLKPQPNVMQPYVRWNPLDDDGDALRLAVRLGMKLSTNLHHRFVTVNDEQEFYDESKFGGVCDPDVVMRRTIVCVAAEIGRQMQEGGAE